MQRTASPLSQVANTNNTTVTLAPVLNAAALGVGGGGGQAEGDDDGMFEATLEDIEAFEEGVVWVGWVVQQQRSPAAAARTISYACALDE